jgi:serralysin
MTAPTPAEIVDVLDYGRLHWPDAPITFSFPKAGSTWPGYVPYPHDNTGRFGNEPTDPAYGVLTPAQADAFRTGVATFARIIAVPIVETDDLTHPGDIRVAFETGGHTNLPPWAGQTVDPTLGDIWIDSYWANKSFKSQYTASDAADPMVLKNFARALGLRFESEGASPLPPDYDSVRYSIISPYWTPGLATLSFQVGDLDGKGVQLWAYGSYAAPDGPMVDDILALQAMYGANPTTNVGATTYSFDEGKPFLTAIYDAGGIDTIDLSSHHHAASIDLTPGAYSSVDITPEAEQLAHWTSLYPAYASDITGWLDRATAGNNLYTGHDNLGIAFGTVIENAYGGSGDDTLVGNAANNSLSGGAGADSIRGAEGDDTINGGAGQNYLRGDDGNDSLIGGAAFDDINGNMGADTIHAGAGDDWAVGGKDNDLIYGDDGADIVYGNLGNDTLDGNLGNDIVRGGQGDDLVFGGPGDDWLSGDRGNDTLYGEQGADIFHSFSGAGIDRVMDFSVAEGDRVQLDPGTTYAVTQVGADTVVDMGGGDQLILVGIQKTTLPAGWIFGA